MLKNRLVFNGRSTPASVGTFLTTPSTCFDPAQPAFAHTYSTYVRADSVAEPRPDLPQRLALRRGGAAAGRPARKAATWSRSTRDRGRPGDRTSRLAGGAAIEVKVPFEPSPAGQETSTCGRRG